MRLSRWLLLLLCPGLLLAGSQDQDTKPASASGELVLVDAKGKENKIKAWEFTTGTRRLSWLAPASSGKEPAEKVEDPARKPTAAQGPLALVFREENSTGFVDGVLTLLPLENVRALEFDSDKESATIQVATSDKSEDDASITGSTRFARVNKFTLEAEVDKGPLGIAAIKYQGGVKNGIRAMRFPAPRSLKKAEGRSAQVTVVDGAKKFEEKVTDLKILYKTEEQERLSPILLFKKTVKLDLSKVKKMTIGEGEASDWTITLQDDSEETLTLLPTGELDGQKVMLVGFLARVPAGYKLFPAHTVGEIQFDQAKVEEKP